ncbi:uncharacterized protein LOC129313047 isoform X2 [Prosopis cineraria]|uniref:uncharacterized protein LOC129313047 isoform X2 n=1 Tax=Prosopis cineraria TaxID=364024 RepID=UPI00240EBC55|nr:uncharacterized protein LOC129313047 isoform X2 [Prosopis cineraria]
MKEMLKFPQIVPLPPRCTESRQLVSRKLLFKRTASGFIELEIPRTIRSFTDFLVCVSARQQSSKTIEVIEMHLHDLESLVIKNSRIEEIFNLMNLNVKKIERGIEPWALSLRSLWLEGLSELRNICVDPKHILRLNNLSCLKIIGCRKLEVVFSASTLRILPKLEELTISECGELVQIIEEENEESARDHLRHEPYFPKLSELTVEGCHRLKYLFSLTVSGILPKPHELCVRDASTLEHVLIRPDEPKEMAMEDVLPNLRRVTLKRNQSLISICHGIDFQTLEESSEVDDCPKFSFHETTANQLQVGPTNLDFERKAEAEKTLSSLLSTNQSYMGETKGRPNLETQQSPLSSPTFSRGAKEGTKEIVEEDVISEITDTHNASLKDNLVCKEEQNGKFMIDPQQPTNGEPYLAKTSKEVRLTTILGGPDSKKIETRNQLTDSKIAEERVEEGDSSETLHPSYLKVSIPTSSNLTNLPVGDITGTTITILEEEEQGEEEGDPSMPLASNISREQTSEATSPKQIPLSIVSESSYGKNIHDNVGTSNQRSHEALDAIEVSSKHAVKHESAEINVPSFNETSNASSVHGLQEIVDTMKLDSVEASILAEAFETHPQLRLSKEDRSTQLLCDSYRVLLDILNILATRTPFTITKEDKKSLVENLKDALVLGFDREWLESVKNNVFNCDVSEVRHMQEVLKSFEDKLETNKTELALVCDQEDEAARRVEVAQKELEAVRARHYQLSKERQDLQNQRDQCRETFAAKFRSFGF